MALKLTSSGVTVTQGRGKAKTVVLDVSFEEIKAWAKRMVEVEKRVWNSAYWSAIKGLKDKFQEIVTHAGGVEGFPKFKDFEAFTKELRAKTNRTAPMGGVLADKKRLFSKFKKNKVSYIGWIDPLANAAVNFQDAVGGRSAENFLTDVKSRQRLHRLGIRDIPRTYTQNPRRVLPEPFATYARERLDNWAEHVFFKEMAKQMGIAAGVIPPPKKRGR